VPLSSFKPDVSETVVRIITVTPAVSVTSHLLFVATCFCRLHGENKLTADTSGKGVGSRVWVGTLHHCLVCRRTYLVVTCKSYCVPPSELGHLTSSELEELPFS
jgi:hypothetical protein